MILVFALGVVSCEQTELDLLADPNNPTPEQASLNDLYNNIQLVYRNTFNSVQGTTGALARMYHAGAAVYLSTIGPTTLNGLWNSAYADLFPDVDALLDIAEAEDGPQFDVHAGSAKVMQAYAMMTLVDVLGDVPFSEAGQGTDIISPNADPGASVYEAAINLLDEAIDQMTGTNSPAPTNDFIYNGDVNKWISAAKTLKLRAAVNTRLVNPDQSRATINDLIAEGDLIDEASEDLAFQYGTERNNPNSRHPFYNSHYEIGDGAYMSNYYMWLLIDDKEDAEDNDVRDPRLRFYFYRKVDDAENQDQTTYGCFLSNLPDQSAKPDHWDAVDPDLNYCYASADGYIGRDHLNPEGIPPDGPIRTSYGLYPGGGQFDFDQFEDTRQRGTTGGLGAGILPIMLSSFTDFMRAEAALTLGTNDDARALLESGIRNSIDKVHSFKNLVPSTMSQQVELRDGSIGTVEELFVPDQEEIDAYVNLVLSNYDAAGTDEERLAIVIKEYYIAAWGNGLEAYNMYRRTGYPDNMQPALSVDPGDFATRYFRPLNWIDRNQNASQQEITGRVFWDNGSANVY